MGACIQNYRTVKRDLDNTVLSIRLTGAEAARFWRIMDDVKARNAYIGKSDVARELLGLVPAHALSPEEIHFFRTGEKSAVGVPVAPSGSKIKLGKLSQETKRKTQ